ncbi:MAG: radical SAM protein, partial [Planctomycetes bacterium]|nr:radical SAM protein [Planctomycetota bacterium]
GLAPSYVINLTGCNLSCLYCYTLADRLEQATTVLTPAGLQEMLNAGRQGGALNVNFIGGEPTVNLPAILELFAGMDESLPLVWNTNAYCNLETLEMVFGLPAVYLADLKFGNPECSRRIGGARDYWEVARNCIQAIYKREPEKLIVRHVLMPGHVECCAQPVLEWFAHNLPGIRVNILTNYLVMPAARSDPKLSRFLTAEEIAQVREIANDLKLNLIAGSDCEISTAGIQKEGVEAGRRQEEVGGEIVISPDGKVYLRYPTKELMELSKAAMNIPEDLREEES